jgi:hypothetical protein
MTAFEWEMYGDLCASHDQQGLTPELRQHIIEEFNHHHNETSN